jgi:hypothetical protein
MPAITPRAHILYPQNIHIAKRWGESTNQPQNYAVSAPVSQLCLL